MVSDEAERGPKATADGVRRRIARLLRPYRGWLTIIA
jgi:hypothetical protein